MPEPELGATYADAIIMALGFAEHHPWRFLLTVPVTLFLLAVIVVVIYRTIIVGPISQRWRDYEEKRAALRRPPEPRLPL